MKKFSRKPSVVEAVQLGRDNYQEIKKWMGDNCTLRKDAVVVHSTDGNVKAKLGDYIVKDADGFKVYSKEGFEKFFDEVKEDKTEGKQEKETGDTK